MKISGYVALTLVGLMAVFLVVIMLLSRHVYEHDWPKRLEHVQLEPTRPMLSEADVTPDNAYYYIRKFSDEYADAISPELREEVMAVIQNEYVLDELPLLTNWPNENEALLAVLHSIANAEYAQVATLTSYDDWHPYISHVLMICRTLAASGYLSALEGDWNRAWTYFQLGLELSDAVAPGGGLVPHLVQYAGRAVILHHCRKAAQLNPPPAALSDEMISILMQRRDPEPFEEAIRHEWLALENAVEKLYGDVSSLEWYIGKSTRMPDWISSYRIAPYALALVSSTPKHTHDHLAAIYSHIIHNYESGNMVKEEELLMPILAGYSFSASRSRSLFNDPVGRLLASLLIPAAHSPFMRNQAATMEPEATAALLAAIRYRADHGRYPEQLADLMPGYLPRLPMDRFNPGEPLRCWVDGDAIQIYSVGPNQQDNGGMRDFFFEQSARDQPLDLLFVPMPDD